MALRWIRWVVLVAALATLGIGLGSPKAFAQVDDFGALQRQIGDLFHKGKYSEAGPIAERYVALARKRLGEEHREFAVASSWLAYIYQAQGRYAEAEPLFKRTLVIVEKTQGPGHPDFATNLNSLARLYQMQGRLAEAEPPYKRSLAILETALGRDHPHLSLGLTNLALLYRDQGRYGDAEPLAKRSLAIVEKARGRDHPDVATSLNNLALLYQAQGKFSDAEPLFKRSLAINEKALGRDHPHVGNALSNLAQLYQDQGRLAEAEPLSKRSLAIAETTLGHDHPDVATALANLMQLYQAQGRYAEAEPLAKRALAIVEKALGHHHPSVAGALYNLVRLYRGQGRYAEAEPLAKRSLAIAETALGRNHPSITRPLNSLANLYLAQSRVEEAEPLYQRALMIAETALGPHHHDVATSLNNLATVYQRQGRQAEAEPLYQRSLHILETALGRNHPDVAANLNNLARLYQAQNRLAEAEPLYRRSLVILETALSGHHPSVASAHSNLGRLALARGDLVGAAGSWRQATTILERRADLGSGYSTGSTRDEIYLRSRFFHALIKTTHRLPVAGEVERLRRATDMFETAQWSQSSDAAISLTQMATRSASGSPQLAALVRERQDLVTEWRAKDKLLIAASGEGVAKRNASAEMLLASRLAEIDRRLADIDARLAKDFSDYAALANPKPISARDVQSVLSDDEALILFLDTAGLAPLPEDTFVWVVTNREVRWVRSEIGTEGLRREVSALRCGLDSALWDDETGSAMCRDLVQSRPQLDGHGNLRSETLPFELVRAHALYKDLLGQVEDLIRGKHLLIVSSGALTQLPFQVLVTGQANDGKVAAWLTRSHAITMLPAAASLKDLRRVGKASVASKPMLAIGNPLLDGDPVLRPWEANWAKLAREKQACAPAVQLVAGVTAQRRVRSILRLATRSGRADLEHLRSQAPLHDTADELCAVASALKLSSDDILLGARATEATIKQLSSSGKLSRYRILHLATHGTIAGEIDGAAEPGLILTPPQEQTDADDGYLSASEVATLKLDAEWVILSACNTAAGGAKGAEALSGLARAFIYAGARALLVSHWAVDSAATVKLITSAVGATTRDAKLGRAEALRGAMLAMIDSSDAREAHPSAWAPFIVVGEGAVK